MAALATALLLPVLAGCGGDNNETSDAADPSTAQTSGTAPVDTPSSSDASSEGAATGTEPPGSEYSQLSKKQMQTALLTIDELPPGYSADPPDDSESSAKYCGSKPDKAPIFASQDFTKGGGFSSELASVGLAQYESSDAASANLERLRKGLRTCKGETVDGDDLTYSVMSTPKMD
jgi:hypothetical protein